MNIRTLEDFIHSNDRNILDYHLVFRNLVNTALFSNKKIYFLVNRILIDGINNVAVGMMDETTNPKYITDGLQYIFRYMKKENHKDQWTSDEKAFYESLNDTNNSDKIKELTKKIFLPTGCSVIGYGTHSIVIMLKRDPKHVFKYSRLGNENENSLKVKLGHEIIYPDIPGINNRYFVSNDYYRNGTLAEFLGKNPNMTNDQKLILFRNIVKVVSDFHKKEIFNRDIKPDNILIDDNGFPVITDLDTAVNKLKDSSDFAGTPLYMAPEVFNAKLRVALYDSKADIYSLGLVLYYMFEGRDPVLVSQNRTFEFTERVPQNVRDLIQEICQVNRDDRLTETKIIEKVDKYISDTQRKVYTPEKIDQQNQGSHKNDKFDRISKDQDSKKQVTKKDNKNDHSNIILNNDVHPNDTEVEHTYIKSINKLITETTQKQIKLMIEDNKNDHSNIILNNDVHPNDTKVEHTYIKSINKLITETTQKQFENSIISKNEDNKANISKLADNEIQTLSLITHEYIIYKLLKYYDHELLKLLKNSVHGIHMFFKYDDHEIHMFFKYDDHEIHMFFKYDDHGIYKSYIGLNLADNLKGIFENYIYTQNILLRDIDTLLPVNSKVVDKTIAKDAEFNVSERTIKDLISQIKNYKEQRRQLREVLREVTQTRKFYELFFV